MPSSKTRAKTGSALRSASQSMSKGQSPPVHKLTYQDRTAQVPPEAMRMNIGEFELGDNGDDAKSAPLRMVVRSGKPIEHWYWGRVVHDLAGAQFHKDRFTVDYCHYTDEVMGYLNKFGVEDGPDGVPELVCSGALVPFKDSDRATEVVFKAKNGVPYEASLDFYGDGIRIEELRDGATAEVNGYTLTGPACIIREWPFRGAAVCPYGADMHTSSEFSHDRQESPATVALFIKETTMAKDQEQDDAAEKATDSSDTPQDDAAEATAVDASAAEGEGNGATQPADQADGAESTSADNEAGEGVETTTDEGQAAGAESSEPGKAAEGGDQPASEFTAGQQAGRTECQRFVKAFGQKGAEWFGEGLTFTEASERHRGELAAENAKLKKRLSAAGEGEDDPLTSQPDSGGNGDDKPSGQFMGLPDGLAQFAANIKLPTG